MRLSFHRSRLIAHVWRQNCSSKHRWRVQWPLLVFLLLESLPINFPMSFMRIQSTGVRIPLHFPYLLKLMGRSIRQCCINPCWVPLNFPRRLEYQQFQFLKLQNKQTTKDSPLMSPSKLNLYRSVLKIDLEVLDVHA